ncbi:MAG: DUF2207 domain-containing protein [Acidobacteriota bacterium]
MTGHRTFTFCLIIILFLLIPSAVQSKSHSMEWIDIKAAILDDGSMRIEETRRYEFRGQFSWADYRLPLKDLGRIKDFEISEGDRIYQESRSEDPGTYTMDISRDEMYLRWFYRASNEKRSFTLRYTITDAVAVYNDVAELYYKFVGESNAKRIGSVNVSIALPYPARHDEVRAWAHGPLWGTIEFKYGILKMDISPLPSHTFWEARVSFPTPWVPHAQKRINQNRLQQILDEEARWATSANAERKRAERMLLKNAENERLGWHIAAVLSAVGVIGTASFYFRYGRRVQVSYSQSVDSSLPEYPPAIFSSLYYNKQVSGKAMVATLFDLARRGFITIEQKEPVERKWWRIDRTLFMIKQDFSKRRSSGEELPPYEQSLLNFVFNDLGAGKESVDFLDFSRHTSKVRRWFREWRKILNDELRAIPFWDREGVKGTILSMVFSVLIVAGGLLITIFLNHKPGFFVIIIGCLCLFFSLFILSYTPEMKLQKLKWRALKRYLTRYYFESETDQGFLYRIPEFLIYGIAMGIGTAVVKRLMQRIPSDQHTTFFPWYIYSGGFHASVGDFAGVISSMVSVASSTVSSSTGAGGGASAGGGGGAGGASGGAG